MFSVTPGPFVVYDADGNALCHSPRQTRQASNSARRRAVIAVWETALVNAGLMTGSVVKCADNVTRDRGKGIDTRDGFADFGHIVSEHNDGAFCGCNAVPLEGSQNRADGDAMPSILWDADTREAYRLAFRAAALATMPKSRAARAV